MNTSIIDQRPMKSMILNSRVRSSSPALSRKCVITTMTDNPATLRQGTQMLATNTSNASGSMPSS